MSTPPKTFEMEMPAYRLGNWAYVRLQDLLDDPLSCRDKLDVDAVEEAELVLKWKRAIAERSDFLLIRLRYEDDKGQVATTGTATPGGDDQPSQ